jgi:hydrogenase assembly chaperone HypC/HupF
MSCRDEHCITCGDVGVPMRVASIDCRHALASCRDAEGATSDVDVALLDRVDAGDAVLVHAGVALVRLEDEEALA